MIILVDLDGTICDCEHRAHFINKYENDTPMEAWEEFHNRELMLKDLPIERSLEVLTILHNKGAEIIYLTARMCKTMMGGEDIEAASREWLNLHGYPDVELRMRPYEVRGKSLDVKRDLTRDLHGRTDVMVIDDKLSIHELALENNWIWCKAPECWETLEKFI